MADLVLMNAMTEQVRTERCMKEIMESCQRWGCQIMPMIQFIGPQVANFGFNVVPIPQVPPGIKTN